MRRFRGVSPELQQTAWSLRDHQTPAEQPLWEALRLRGLNGLRFRRQRAVERFVLDFYCAERRLAVEVDGGIHRSHAEHDALRTEELHRLGIRLIRVTNEDVLTRPPWVLERISEAAAE